MANPFLIQAQPDQANRGYLVIGRITLSGNKVTRQHIIEREFPFATGDTLNTIHFQQKLDELRNNLLNTSLFNFVTIDTTQQPGTNVADIHVSFIERWYLWPAPYVTMADRNFNEWWDNKDFGRLNYSIVVQHSNVRGRREILQVQATGGFEKSFTAWYFKPYLNRRQTLGAGMMVYTGHFREIPCKNVHDKQVFLRSESGWLLHHHQAVVTGWYRPRFHQTHNISLQYDQYQIAPEVFAENPEYFSEPVTNPRFFSLLYSFKSNYRDQVAYPLRGHLIEADAAVHGIGVLQNHSLSVAWFRVAFKSYHHVSQRIFAMSGITGKVSFPRNQPYFLRPELGHLYDYIRGYEPYVIAGRHYALIRTNLKYEIIPRKIFRLPLIKNERFAKGHVAGYAGVHADIGWTHGFSPVSSEPNSLPDRWLAGWGVGFDVAAYYDKVLRLEYSFNKLGEGGFFVHFLAPI